MGSRWTIASCLLLVACGPEQCPFEYAPPCPQWEWHAPPQADPDAMDGPQLEAAIPPENEEIPLCELIDIALQNSWQTRNTWAKARNVAAKYGESRSEFYPDVDLKASIEAKRQPDFIARSELLIQEIVKYGPQLTMSYLLFNFGAREAKVRSLWEALIDANFSHNRKIQTVVQTVMSDYYAYMAEQEQVAAGTANVRDAEVNLKATVSRHLAGVSDLGDQLQAESQLAQQELTLLQDGQEMADGLAQLVEDLGVPIDIALKVEGLPEQIPMEKLAESVDDLISQAYCTRPDLKATQADIRSSKAMVMEAKRNRWPQVTFDGAVGRTTYNLDTNDNYDYHATLQVAMPLFRGFYYRNKVRQAQATLEKSLAGMRELESAIVKEVVQSYKDFNIAGDKVKTAESFVRSATGSYTATLRKYKAGTTDYTPLFQSLATLADARSALVSARKDWYTSLTDLSYATGTIAPCCGEIQ